MYQERNPMDEIRRFFRSKAILPRLIIINSGIWILIGILRVFGFLLNYPNDVITSVTIEYLALPANLEDLAVKPWTLFTYMFLHIDFFHILFNMLWLYWFGKIFLEFMREKQLLLVYLFGGIAGGILYILFFNVFPVFEKSLDQSVALGASASVMAIVAAISFYVPGYSVYLLLLGKVRIFYIAIALFIMDFFMIRSENAGGHIAHIGGAMLGISYILARRKGMNFGEIFSNWHLFNRSRGYKKRKDYAETDNDPWNNRPVTDEEYNRRKAIRQKQIDGILDKIAKSGYESLTKEEKEILFKSGNSG